VKEEIGVCYEELIQNVCGITGYSMEDADTLSLFDVSCIICLVGYLTKLYQVI